MSTCRGELLIPPPLQTFMKSVWVLVQFCFINPKRLPLNLSSELRETVTHQSSCLLLTTPPPPYWRHKSEGNQIRILKKGTEWGNFDELFITPLLVLAKQSYVQGINILNSINKNPKIVEHINFSTNKTEEFMRMDCIWMPVLQSLAD